MSISSASVKNPDRNNEKGFSPEKGIPKLRGRFLPGLIFAIGYILSPLSWWNDVFINLPLAWLIGTAANFFFPGAFQIGMIGAYWLSNLSGILFMLWGGSRLLGKQPPKKSELGISVVVSLLYTLGIYLLMRWGVVKPFTF